MADLLGEAERVSWQVVIRPDSRLWSYRLSGGMSVRTFMRTLASPEPKAQD